jgi:hypothetical protein
VLLNDAIASGDANRIAAFFRGFQQEAGNTQPPAYANTASTRTRSSGRPIYTRTQIKEIYRPHQQGAYVGREAEYARLDADIIRASAEGRILGGVDVAGK